MKPSSFTAIVLLAFASLPFTFEVQYSKSYLYDDHSSVFLNFEADQNWLYIPFSNDIVQRSIETGRVGRTLRGHSVDVQDLCLVNETTLFSGSADGIIVQWDLDSGSIIKRLDSKCNLANLAIYLGNVLVTCHRDNSRMLNAETNVVLATFTVGQHFYVYQDYFYGFYTSTSLELFDKNLTKSLVAAGTFSALTRSDDFIFIVDTVVFQISSISILDGQIRDFVGSGHNALVFSMCVLNETLVSAGTDGFLILWNVSTRLLVRSANLQLYSLYMVKKYNETFIFVGSQSSSVVLIDIHKSTLEISKTYTGQPIFLTSLAVHDDSIFSGSRKVPLKEWSISEKELVQIFKNHSLSSDIFTFSNYLLSCNNSIIVSDISTGVVVKEFAQQQVYCWFTFFFHEGFLFAPNSQNQIVYKYNLSSSALVLQFRDNSINSAIINILAYKEYLFVTYTQLLITQWNVEVGQLEFSQISVVTPSTAFFVFGDQVVYSRDGTISMVDPTSFTLTEMKDFEISISAFAYDPVTRFFFLGGDPPSISVINPDNYETVYELYGHMDIVNHLLVYGSYLFSCSSDGTVKQFSLDTRRIVFSFEDRGQSITSVVCLNNSLIFGTLGGTLYDFKQDSGMFSDTLSGFKGSITDILLIDGLLIISSADQTISLWYTSIYDKLLVLNVTSIPNALDFSEGFLYSGNTDHSVTKWNYTSRIIVKSFLGHNAIINDIVVDYTNLFTAGNDFFICRWDLYLSIITIRYKGHYDSVTSIVLFESKLFSGSLDKTIIVWDIDKGSILKTLKRTTFNLGHVGPINEIKICNGYLFSASSDLTIKQWDVSTGLVVDTFFGHLKGVTCLYCFGVSLFSGSEDFSVLLWHPQYPNKGSTSAFSSIKSKDPVEVFLNQTRSNTSSLVILSLSIAAGLTLLLVIMVRILVFIKQKGYRERDEKLTSFTSQNTNMNSYSSTMFTQSLGLALPGFLEIFYSSITLKKQIAKGGGGTIFMCEISGKPQVMVAKVFSDKFEYLSAKRKLSFDQEITIMEYLKSHRNIAKIVGYCRNQPCAIIMKFYEKGSLDNFLRSNSSGEKSYSKAVMVRFLKDISQSLQFMHTKQLAHCDIKPLNILIDEDDNGLFLVLTDFGITIVLDQTIIAAQTFTVVNLKGISAYYAGPEVFERFKRAQYYDPQIIKAGDIYSFSVIVYEMLVKRIPWCYT